MTLADFLVWYVIAYLVFSPVLLAAALWSLRKARFEIRELKDDVERLDADIDDLWGPTDPDDGGEDNQEIAPSNVIAFGRKAS